MRLYSELHYYYYYQCTDFKWHCHVNDAGALYSHNNSENKVSRRHGHFWLQPLRRHLQPMISRVNAAEQCQYASDSASSFIQCSDTVWLGNRKGIWLVKSWVLVCWCWRYDWSFARLIAPAVTTTSIILGSNKIQNRDILIPANPGPPGKWLIKRRESVSS